LTDALCVLFEFKGDSFQEIGRTEIVPNTLNPQFIETFEVLYRFEERQRFIVKVYDAEQFNVSLPLDRHTYLGEMEFMLHEVVTQKN
jgi:Ca2+-dependent lipid-binding protein